MPKTLLRSLAAAMMLAAPVAASADHLRPHLLLSARLSGDQEVPAVTTSAQGVAGFTLNVNRDTLFVQAAFSGLSGAITGAHVHEGAAGVSGPIVTGLASMVRGSRLSGFLTGNDITPDKLAKYLRGLYYLNVHTAVNPGGEIRGQIRLESDIPLIANLTGAQQVPAVTTNASGLGTFTLNQNFEKLKFRVAFAGLSGPVTAVHFHTGAAGATGPVIVGLASFLSGNVVEGEIVPTQAFLTSLLRGEIYFNLHTAANPTGEIRGQLAGTGRFVPFDARLDGGQMVPAIATTAKGLAIGRLSPTLDTMTVFVAHAGLSGALIELALYNAPAGQATTTANFLGSVAVPATNTSNIFGVTVPNITPMLANGFLRGDIALVFNTAANPNGEVRGQVLRFAREGYTISLNGAQQRPNPTTSTGYGVGVVSIDREQSNARFMSVWGGLSGPVTNGHFHTGLSTQAGPVVFGLAPYFDNAAAPTAVYGFWNNNNAGSPFTSRRSLQFRRDSVYMNLHTAAFPSGEIRGQVFRGARNLQRVLATQPAAVVAGSFGTAPNPFGTALTLSFEARATGFGQMQVTDVLGRPVATQTVPVRIGANAVPLALPGVAPGLYLLTLRVGDTRTVTRIAKE